MKRCDFTGHDGLFTRREFIRAAIGASLAMTPVKTLAAPIFSSTGGRKEILLNDAPDTLWKWSKEIYFSKKLGNGVVVCLTCPNTCVLPPDGRSRCRSHVNKGGTLYTLVYGNPCAIHIDPIEKKPLYHFFRHRGPFPSPPRGAASTALTARTGKYHRPGRKRGDSRPSFLLRWWTAPYRRRARQSHTPTRRQRPFMNT